MEWRRSAVRVWKYQGAVLEAVGFAALWVVLTLEALSVWLFGRWRYRAVSERRVWSRESSTPRSRRQF